MNLLYFSHKYSCLGVEKAKELLTNLLKGKTMHSYDRLLCGSILLLSSIKTLQLFVIHSIEQAESSIHQSNE